MSSPRTTQLETALKEIDRQLAMVSTASASSTASIQTSMGSSSSPAETATESKEVKVLTPSEKKPVTLVFTETTPSSGVPVSLVLDQEKNLKEELAKLFTPHNIAIFTEAFNRSGIRDWAMNHYGKEFDFAQLRRGLGCFIYIYSGTYLHKDETDLLACNLAYAHLGLAKFCLGQEEDCDPSERKKMHDQYSQHAHALLLKAATMPGGSWRTKLEAIKLLKTLGLPKTDVARLAVTAVATYFNVETSTLNQSLLIDFFSKQEYALNGFEFFVLAESKDETHAINWYKERKGSDLGKTIKKPVIEFIKCLPSLLQLKYFEKCLDFTKDKRNNNLSRLCYDGTFATTPKNIKEYLSNPCTSPFKALLSNPSIHQLTEFERNSLINSCNEFKEVFIQALKKFPIENTRVENLEILFDAALMLANLPVCKALIQALGKHRYDFRTKYQKTVAGSSESYTFKRTIDAEIVTVMGMYLHTTTGSSSAKTDDSELDPDKELEPVMSVTKKK